MLRDIRLVSGRDRTFGLFVGAVVASAVLQAGAILCLYSVLTRVFSRDPASAGAPVMVLLLFILAAWVMDMVAAHRGLGLGVRILRRVHEEVPRYVLTPEGARALALGEGSHMSTLVATRAVEATSAVVLVVAPVVSAVVVLITLAVGLLWVSPILAAVTLVSACATSGALWASRRLEARADAEFATATERLDARLFEFAWAQPSLRTAGRTSEAARWVQEAIAGTKGRTTRLLLWQIPGQVLFSLVVQCVLLLFGFVVWRDYDAGDLSGAEAAASVVVLLRVIEQVMSQAGSAEALGTLRRTLAQVREAMEAPHSVLGEVQHRAPRVQLRNVRVRFPDGTVGLNGLDVALEPGTVTVVVGPSGSGKSTLLRALAGLVDVAEGQIVVDGVEATGALLRTNAAMTFQDPVVSSGTLADNLHAIAPQLTDERRSEIAESSGLGSMVEDSPLGWATSVGPMGRDLSGGERQRLGLARALAKGSGFLLVDEATSALDSHNEWALVESLRQLRKDHTIVVVAHRPAVLEIADRVLVMDQGVIVEQGSVVDLETAGGVFSRMRQRWSDSAAWSV